MAEKHELTEVQQNVEALRESADKVRAKMKCRVTCVPAPAGTTEPPEGAKLIHFIRHGEGFHNVAQREWRADPNWDGTSEPYTKQTDPDFKYIDAELNEKGMAQATELQQQTEALKPELLVVSPMRRATVTGLLAFAPHIERKELEVLANELVHERAGKHTCDKRMNKSNLEKLYPDIDYFLIKDEEDPFWGYGITREPWADTAVRAGYFIDWLWQRPERHVAVAAHSAILLSIFNGGACTHAFAIQHTAHHSTRMLTLIPALCVRAVEVSDEATQRWFGTGEMRSVLLTETLVG